MENFKENVHEPERAPVPPPYIPAGAPRRDVLRTDPRHKSPLLAALFSFIPGLGQVYVGYYQQGFINIIIVAGIISLLSHDEISGAVEPFLAIFMAFYWFYNIIDAYRRAAFYNHALSGLGELELPESERFPGGRGSLLGGVILLVAGIVALSVTLFGLPLDWIGRWWPLALILMGACLLYQSFVQRKKA